MPDGNKQGGGRGNQSERPENYRQRRQSQRQRPAVVERTAIVEVGEAALLSAAIQAGRTQVLVIELDVAQRAQKTSARIARSRRLFVGMIKATRLPFGHQNMAALRRSGLLEKGREHLDPEQRLARRTVAPVRLVEPRFIQHKAAPRAGHDVHPTQRWWTTRVLQM